MNIKSPLKALPFLSILIASLALTPGISIAADNGHGQYRNQHAQYNNNIAQHVTKKARRHRSNSRSYNKHYTPPRQHVENTHAYTVTRIHRPLYLPAPHIPSIALGLRNANVSLTLRNH